ncbi:MAG: PilZ domain-containing protein [Candidatus Omnitrophota bacterium]|nr:PilZ domain-containing protein [Candidatus Omnitrophota bacterium]MBU1929246.1 PilZ domain-containing protein [Candidatus Omnitrophota bacterium]MBU2034371.1 PilZ domain-containing protein [Candidatus Omnitrophota bacterium]MBU2221554.1 PilZ domain-containing protein [Candidatus Omnitrophota bacterium]MBU2258100.1 PilZ domain-containing protein [Candidatus Omnitrophota bacterium]
MINRLIEKRQHPRLKLAHPISFEIPGAGEINNALSNDISIGGIGFVNDRFIPMNTPLKLKINILSKVLNSVGMIKRSIPIPHSDRYYTGIEFKEFNLADRKYLNDYIQLKAA